MLIIHVCRLRCFRIQHGYEEWWQRNIHLSQQIICFNRLHAFTRSSSPRQEWSTCTFPATIRPDVPLMKRKTIICYKASNTAICMVDLQNTVVLIKCLYDVTGSYISNIHWNNRWWKEFHEILVFEQWIRQR